MRGKFLTIENLAGAKFGEITTDLTTQFFHAGSGEPIPGDQWRVEQQGGYQVLVIDDDVQP